MDLLSRAVTAFSPGYRAGTTIPGLKVEPSVPGHRAGTQPGLKVPFLFLFLFVSISIFLFFLFLIDDSFWFLNTHSTLLEYTYVYNVQHFI